MIKRVVLIAVVLASCFGLGAQVTYTMSFPNLPAGFSETLNATNDVTTMVQVRVTRSATNNTPLDYYILVGSIVPGCSEVGERRAYASNNSQNNSILYRVLPTFSSSVEIDYAQSLNPTVEIAGGMLKNKTDDYIQFYIKIPKGSVPLGDYTSTMSLALYTGSKTAPAGTATPASGGILPITIHSTASSNFSITFDPPSADFGTIDPAVGISTPENLGMYVTAPPYYSISVCSASQGNLVHTVSPDQKIPYRLKFNDKSSTDIDLSNGLKTLVSYAATQADSLRYDLYFYVDPVDLGTSLLEGGQYRDNLYFTFTSQ
jgi:hypothetical protein